MEIFYFLLLVLALVNPGFSQMTGTFGPPTLPPGLGVKCNQTGGCDSTTPTPTTTTPPPTTTTTPENVKFTTTQPPPPSCECCWPVPESCCKEETTTTAPTTTTTKIPSVDTTTEVLPPPTTPPPECPCKADVLILLDRSGSIAEFSAFQGFTNDLLAALDPDCFPASVITFAKTAITAFGFGDTAATDRGESSGIVSMLDRNKGDTFTHVGLQQAIVELGNQVDIDCRDVVVLLTDGGSDLKDETIAAAAALKAQTDAWVCIVRYKPADETIIQFTNRMAEVTAIWGNSKALQSTIVEDNAAVPFPPDLVAQVKACICQDC